jgi:hypothetical protein
MFPGEVVNSKLSNENVHPFYHNWYHPLWKEAIKSLQLGDYKDSPYYSISNLDHTSITSTDHYCNNGTLDNTIRGHNSEIFDKIGHLGNITEAQRINKMREHFNNLEKLLLKVCSLPSMLYVP